MVHLQAHKRHGKPLKAAQARTSEVGSLANSAGMATWVSNCGCDHDNFDKWQHNCQLPKFTPPDIDSLCKHLTVTSAPLCPPGCTSMLSWSQAGSGPTSRLSCTGQLHARRELDPLPSAQLTSLWIAATAQATGTPVSVLHYLAFWALFVSALGQGGQAHQCRACGSMGKRARGTWGSECSILSEPSLCLVTRGGDMSTKASRV